MHKCHKDPEFDNVYVYRGFWINRNDATPNGYYGRWSVSGVGGVGRMLTTSSMRNCKQFIDAKLDAAASAQTEREATC